MSDQFHPCLLIPVYNHGALITATLARLERFQLPCLIIDDGSDLATAHILQQLDALYPWVQVHRHVPNQGKGVAVLRGIALARAMGYSHALQVDADGQHAVDDIPQMLAMAEAEPDALISGAPIYDQSVPKSRFYGRYLTHVWVWIETLSLSIIDSMCGFRVYPVIATDDLAKRQSISQRMDFDTDIMVRLYWRGVPVRFLKTAVQYPEEGISHFDMWWDNVRITRMHVRLVCGMLLRSPLLLLRKLRGTKNGAANKHWSEIQEAGTYAGMAFCVGCYRLLGKPTLYALLYPIMGYFFLTNGQARKHSLTFLRRAEVFRQSRSPSVTTNKQPGWRDSFRHFMNFGRCIVDRIGAWSGDLTRADLDFPNRDLLQRLVERGQGGVILSSHLGNMEVCRAIANSLGQVKINVLLFTDNAVRINRIMQRINPQVAVELIQIRSIGPDTAMILNQKISEGEFVVIAADRTPAAAPAQSVAANFMGAPAYFPTGAFVLAGLMECPVMMMCCLKQENRYHAYFEHFAPQLPVPRKQRQQLVQQYVQQYAARLEDFALRAPDQWYNFFDFWAPPAEPGSQAQASSTKSSMEQTQ